LVELITQTKPEAATQWSARKMAAELGVSVSRHWRKNGLKPHLVRGFKVSRDPLFVQKLEDIIGVYVSPPERAIVLCCDEKSQVQGASIEGWRVQQETDLPGQSRRPVARIAEKSESATQPTCTCARRRSRSSRCTSRVLPMPQAPVTVTSRCPSSSAANTARSWSHPIKRGNDSCSLLHGVAASAPTGSTRPSITS